MHESVHYPIPYQCLILTDLDFFLSDGIDKIYCFCFILYFWLLVKLSFYVYRPFFPPCKLLPLFPFSTGLSFLTFSPLNIWNTSPLSEICPELSPVYCLSFVYGVLCCPDILKIYLYFLLFQSFTFHILDFNISENYFYAQYEIGV